MTTTNTNQVLKVRVSVDPCIRLIPGFFCNGQIVVADRYCDLPPNVRRIQKDATDGEVWLPGTNTRRMPTEAIQAMVKDNMVQDDDRTVSVVIPTRFGDTASESPYCRVVNLAGAVKGFTALSTRYADAFGSGEFRIVAPATYDWKKGQDPLTIQRRQSSTAMHGKTTETWFGVGVLMSMTLRSARDLAEELELLLTALNKSK